jgi:predicted metal-dependent phosphoesterase TrpH
MTLVDVREKDEVARRLHPGGDLDPAGLPRDPGRAEAPGQERPHRRLLRGRHALGARRGDAAGARLHERRDGESRLRALERPGLPRRGAARADRRAARALLAAHPLARGRRGWPGQAPQEQGASARRWRPRLAGGIMYLAAAGVGTLGIVDADVVDASNLQRQIVHATSRVGTPKVESAAKTVAELNPDVKVVPYKERLTSANVERFCSRLRRHRRRNRQLSRRATS